MLFIIGCNNIETNIFEVDYDTILSDSTNKRHIVSSSEELEFKIKNKIEISNEFYKIQYSKGIINDTLWHYVTTRNRVTDSIIDALKFNQKDQILDRIYLNKHKENSRNISIDFLQSYMWENTKYFNIQMLEIDSQGIFQYLERVSKIEREIRTLNGKRKYSGTYTYSNEDLKIELRLRDSRNTNNYTMVYRIEDSKGCASTISQLNEVIEKGQINLDSMQIQINNNNAEVEINDYVICDTISKSNIILKKVTDTNNR